MSLKSIKWFVVDAQLNKEAYLNLEMSIFLINRNNFRHSYLVRPIKYYKVGDEVSLFSNMACLLQPDYLSDPQYRIILLISTDTFTIIKISITPGLMRTIIHVPSYDAKTNGEFCLVFC